MSFLEKVKKSTYLIFLFIPIIFSFFWHFNNSQIPVSDAIGWLEASFKILEPYWNSGSISGTLYELFTERSWRPVIFHLFVVPFLWITNGDFLMASLLVHVSFVSLSTLIIFKFFRLRLDRFSSAISTSIVCLSTNIMFGGIGLPLFAELSFTPFFLCTIYCLIQSNYFSNKTYSIFFSLFFFLIFATRPIEALMYVTLPLLFFFYKGVSENRIELISVLKGLLISFIAVSLLCISRFIPKVSNSIKSLDPPYSLEIYTIVSTVIVITTLLISLYYFYLRTKNNSYKDTSYLIMAFKIHTFLIFIWWYGHFSSLYEWVYQTSFGSIVSYYEPTDKFYLLIFAFKSFGLYIFPIILIIFILIKLYNFIKRVNYVFFEEYYYLLLTIPIPWTIYLFSVQGFYRKISLSLVCLLVFFLINIMSKKEYLRPKQIFFLLLVSIQVASISTHTFLKEANDQFWSFKNRNSTASNFIGHEYPLPINIQPNYHNKVVDFLDYQGQKKGYKRFAITLDESGVPIDAFVIALLCRTNKYICTLPYNARSKLLLGTYDNKNKFREDFILLKNEFLRNRYDVFFLVNPKSTLMQINEKEANKALDLAINKVNTSPSARFAYYLKYLYSANKLMDYNLKLTVCLNINEIYDGCIIEKFK